MAYANTHFGYHQSVPEAAINNKRPSYFDEDDGSAVLDSGILDADIMQSPADAQPRKGSFANNNGVLTPVESQGWGPRYGNTLPVEPSAAGPPHPYHDGFSGRAPPHISTFAHPPHPEAWQYEQGSGHCTPTNGVDLDFIPQPPPPGYEHAHYNHHRNDSARGSFSHAGPVAPHPPQHFNHPHSEGTFHPAPQVQTPMSPHSHQDWMAVAQNELEARSMSKRMRPNSPPRTSVDLQRRDGIRKKNGRIDIPNERTIQTIDDLIEKSTDEELLKELKQQKRLLRNREAALASRQRKKKHTEDLEVQTKTYSSSMHVLEAQNSRLEYEVQQRDRSNQIIMHKLEEAKRLNDVVQDEKRDMLIRHTEETATLRKRIQVLSDQLNEGPAMMSAQPSSTGFNDFTGEMEALNMGAQDWDNFDFFTELNSNLTDDFSFDPKPEHSPVIDKRHSPTTVVASSEKKTPDSSSEQPVASGLLFFLLLCGAFVASKPASSRPSDLPQVPDHVREAAPAVLNNLLAESGSSSTQHHHKASTRSGFEPAPSNIALSTKPRGRLDQMHHRITSPSKGQEADAAFSLTTQQYASISGMDYLSHNEQPGSSSRHNTPPGRRRNLAEMLSNMQDEHARNNKAEVYTRSLLWDQIPTDVVRQFKEMVQDHHEIEARQQGQTSHDDMFSFKVET